MLFSLGLFSFAGCSHETIYLDDPIGSPPPWDAGYMLPDAPCQEPSGIDLLFVIDNSGSMAEEQASLAAQLPSFVRALVDPPDEDGDGEPDWFPIRDLQVGVVTADMGSGGFSNASCTNADFGEDAVLRTRGSGEEERCMATFPPFFAYSPSARSPEELAFDVGCVAQAGTRGCGFEQPLEAMLKALSPAAPTSSTLPTYTPPTFFGGASGHGDGANRGFLRDDTLLAVVIVADEDDCSAAQPALFDPDSREYREQLNVRCAVYEDALHPIERYVDGLAALRARRPDLLAIGIVAGIPTDLAVSTPAEADYVRILADDRMQVRVESGATLPTPSCEDDERGLAFPPRRLVSMARQLGHRRSTVQSLCQGDFTPAGAAFARLFGRRACARFAE